MADPDQREVTEILVASTSEPRAADRLMPLVYEQLRALAARYMQGDRRDHSLQPTALVHEAYLRLVDQTQVDWRGKAHFFAVAAKMMRRVLVNHAKAHQAQKRGGGAERVDLSEAYFSQAERKLDVMALDTALDRLHELEPRHAEVVELRFFGSLSIRETAEVMGVSAGTVKSDWRAARAWLLRELESTV